MKRLLVALAAAATASLASASDSWGYTDWFSSDSSQSTGVDASWSTNVWDDVEEAYVIDADVADPVTLTPSVDAPDTNTVTKIAVSAKMTPTALESYEGGPGDGAQTALIAAFDEVDNNVTTNYYAWLNREWVALSGATPGDGTTAVDLTIEFDYTRSTPKAKFTVGNTALNTNGVEWIDLVGVSTNTVSSVAFAGSGSVTSVDADVGIGVASVNGVKYGTFDEALAAVASAPEGEQYVELLADASVNFDAAGTTLAVRENSHTLTVTTTGDIAVTRTPNASTGIFTYTTADGVAAVYHAGTNTWYGTFAAAYDAAHAINWGDYPTLTVKVGSDFTPEITYSQFFQKITFVSTTEDPITVNLKNAAGTYTMTAVGYQASSNVKLVLPADFNAVNNAYLTGGCTVEVPEGVTLTLAPGSSSTLSNIGGLVGAGTLVAPTDSGALWNFIASEVYSGWLKAATWTGTVQLSGDMTGLEYTVSLANISNANASVRFSGFTNYVHVATSASSFEAIELVGDGLTLAGDYSTQNLVWTFTNALKGDGTLNVAVTGNGGGNHLKTIKFTGDVSGFAGNIKFTNGASSDARDVLIFGNDSSSVTQAVVVSSGVVMTNATGKTWNAPGGVVVNGTLVANGTVTTTATLDGSGIYEVNATTAAIKVADTWTGTYTANFKANNNAIFYIPVNASATTVINGVNGEFGGYPVNSSGSAPNVAGSVTLIANWTVDNGWDNQTTTFSRLSGSGNLTVNGTGSGTTSIPYNITELENYTGTLGGNRGAFTIGLVNVATLPADGARVVKMAIGANGSMLSDNVPLYVDGVDTGKTLKYEAAGAEGQGLYYYSDEPTIPVVSPSTNNVVECESATVATNTANAYNANPAAYIKTPAAANIPDGSPAASVYANFFTARPDGTSVVIELKEVGTNALETASTNVAVQVATNLADIAATSTATNVTITGAQPGFYYSVVYDDDLTTLDTAGVKGNRAVANADGTVTLPIPAKKENATAGFYRVKVSAQASE